MIKDVLKERQEKTSSALSFSTSLSFPLDPTSSLLLQPTFLFSPFVEISQNINHFSCFLSSSTFWIRSGIVFLLFYWQRSYERTSTICWIRLLRPFFLSFHFISFILFLYYNSYSYYYNCFVGYNLENCF